MYSINIAEHNKKFCLSQHYNGANSYLSISGKEIHKIRAKDSEIVTTPLCLGNVSKDWTVDNMETGVNSLNKIPLSCISMNNQECKVSPQFVSVNGDDPVFFLIMLKQVNPAVVATISIIHMQNCVFLMLLKI